MKNEIFRGSAFIIGLGFSISALAQPNCTSEPEPGAHYVVTKNLCHSGEVDPSLVASGSGTIRSSDFFKDSKLNGATITVCGDVLIKIDDAPAARKWQGVVVCDNAGQADKLITIWKKID